MKTVLYVFALLLIVSSCKNDSGLEGEIANVNTDVKIERFDMLFKKVNEESFPNLKKSYPFMFPEKYTDSFWLARKEDSLQIQLLEEVVDEFAEFENVEGEIESLFNHIKYYFPEFNPPRIITVTNDVDYRNSMIVTDTIALIALDSYLGGDHKFYQGIPKYVRANLRKEQIVVDLADAYAEKFIFQPKRKSLLDEMIYFGKQLYFKDVVIPFKTDAEKIAYTSSELEWAKSNESYIWRYFVERELLFSNDTKLPSRFINPAPFSKFFLEEIDTDSPGRLGRYIGWQIVRAYMENNNVSLNEMLIKSTEDIFNNSKFKPRK
ncbi:gliding motility lipoprotein GldB [Flavisericum labens]